MIIIRSFIVSCSLMVAGTFTGCAVHQPLDIELNPEASAQGYIHDGEAKKISLAVIDERPFKEIGIRGFNTTGGVINVKGDVPTLIETAIRKQLEEGNFKIENGGDSNIANFAVEVRHLKYELLQNMMSATAKGHSAMKATCTSANGEIYQKLYTGTHGVDDLVIAPNEEKIVEIVEEAVGSNLNNMANDKKLVDCLSAIKK